eukprot:TRINITY_DN25970_c0_g1_i1.p1 TRINITY_DN25970_c0_g1~~TRINITY_DN25970_c0_g1_i1.p1  ORF type:complete len:220 (+),score=55.93 TRINITY_DN25970_c0_g1_i1:69-662(+)
MGERQAYAAAAIELLKELKRAGNDLPPANKAILDYVGGEIRMHCDEARALTREYENELDVTPEVRVAVAVHHAAIERNKRIVVAYLVERLRRVRSIRWEHGALMPEATRDAMTEGESDFLTAYQGLLLDFSTDMGVDLTGQLTEPPRDLFIEVRALESCGEIWTGAGPIHIEKNNTYLLRKSDVEDLLHRGILERTS